ncbi:DUF416 family protein [Xanthocytophaga flava]|uniref:DUF416 family protein n=1 Tax=Xanthocytophaga flava TaxID=3048013 RepID=UPI0028D0A41B|nr:DUF416 family protein [Xanthocytophaga flavus]MDJ1470200.1 DUF416 family protein [Xanthocytophaga flavus]
MSTGEILKQLAVIIEKQQILSVQQQILFAALTCEKMYPTYEAFVKENKWGDEKLLQLILVSLYEVVHTEKIDQEELQSQKKDIDTIIPDTGDFPYSITSYAIDTCFAFYDTLELLSTLDIQSLSNVSTHSINMIDMFVSEVLNLDSTDLLSEKKILANNYMVAEMARQLTLITELSAIQSIDIAQIQRLRRINESYLTFDISLIKKRNNP